MLNYMITDDDLLEMMHMLEWAQYAIRQSLQRDEPVQADLESSRDLLSRLCALRPVEEASGDE